MTVLTDLYKSVLYNDGEDLVFGDQNDGQRFLAARLYDQVLEKLIGNPNGLDPELGDLAGANSSTAWAYCLDIGSARPVEGSATNKIKVSAGTLMQKIANAAGAEPTLLAFTFDGTTEFTIANGNASNPRVDMLQMKLEYVAADMQSRDFQDAVTGANTSQSLSKKRQVQCTLSLKQGTPAASPTYPTPDAGYVPIACVVVPTNYTFPGADHLLYIDDALGGPYAVIHDLRMPVNVSPEALWPNDAAFDATYWTKNTSPSAPKITCAALAGTSPSNALYFFTRRRKGRLLGVRVWHDHGLNTSNLFRTCVVQPSNGAYFYLADITAAVGNTSNTTNYIGDMMATLSDLEKENITSGGSAGAQTPFVVNGNGTHAPPVWANGSRGHYEENTAKNVGWDLGVLAPFGLAIEQKNDVNGPIVIYAVEFYWAAGI